MRRLEIACLRNLASIALDLNPQFNYLFGPNGAGKTSVLEAVHVLARGRSFRSRRIAPLIQDGESGLLVRACLEGGRTVAVSKDRAGKTELRLDRATAHRQSDVAALLPVHLMLPDVGELVFGGPGERRRYLDWGMFHMKPQYLSALRDYLSALRNRNALLKSWGHADAGKALAVWTQALCDHAEIVHEQRSAYAADLLPCIGDALAGLEAGVDVEMEYRRGWGEESLQKQLGETQDNDVKSGVTGLGPHRADLALRVAGRPAGDSLSRGQGKLVAIGLVLAQATLLQARTGQRGIFLIDDMGAEIDRARGVQMLSLLRSSGCQVIATSIRQPGKEFDALLASGSLSVFHVKQGEIAKAEEH